MNQHRMGQNLFYFISLQMSDHMEPCILRHPRALFQDLLNFIFTKNHVPLPHRPPPA